MKMLCMKKKISMAIVAMAMSQMACAQLATYRQGLPLYLPTDSCSVEWQRSVYREIDLSKNVNAGLNYVEDGQNFFSRIFDLVLDGNVHAYEFSLNAKQEFNARTLTDIKKVMKDFHIPYTERNGRLVVAADNIPLEDVTLYYIKESLCFDKINSMFRTIPVAICPVIVREDDFEGEKTKYPLFWVTFKELTPYISNTNIYVGSDSWTSKMNVADFFVRNIYKGDIYRMSDMWGKSLIEYADNDSVLQNQRRLMEYRLAMVKKRTYNTFASSTKKEDKDSTVTAPRTMRKRTDNKKK